MLQTNGMAVFGSCDNDDDDQRAIISDSLDILFKKAINELIVQFYYFLVLMCLRVHVWRNNNEIEKDSAIDETGELTLRYIDTFES